MQTRKPRKRTKPALVIALIIIIPLLIFLLILTNTAPEQTGEKFHDSVKVGNQLPDTTQVTTNPDTLKK
jgi:hypothetical protein